MKGVVLDAGALLALEHRDRRALALMNELLTAKTTAHASAGVVAQVWRGSPRQHAVARLLRAEAVRVHSLTDASAHRVGRLLGSSNTADVVDAHVALLGRALQVPVVTSDPNDIERLAPELSVVRI